MNTLQAVVEVEHRRLRATAQERAARAMDDEFSDDDEEEDAEDSTGEARSLSISQHFRLLRRQANVVLRECPWP
jgi:hypothetical protein